MSRKNPSALKISDLSPEVGKMLVDEYGYEWSDKAAPVVIQVFGDMLKKYGDERELAKWIGVPFGTLSFWVHRYMSRPILTEIDARDRKAVEKWQEGATAVEATGIGDRAKANVRIVGLREKYGEDVVPLRGVKLDPDYERKVIEGWAAGQSAQEATGRPPDKASVLIAKLREKHGVEVVPLRRIALPFSDKEIIRRWRAGYDSIEATGASTDKGASSKIQDLRRIYGEDKVPRRTGAGVRGGWKWVD